MTGSHDIIEQCVTTRNNDTGISLETGRSVVNDGFACKLNPGKGNRFVGCRAWENSDDGFDLYLADYAVVLDHCWTWHNGDPSSFGYTGAGWSGNGNGFKLGGVTLKDCLAYDSHTGFFFDLAPDDGSQTRLKGCLAFGNGTDSRLSGDAIQTENSWQAVDGPRALDYVELSEAAAKGPRDARGELPAGFATLVKKS